MPKALSRVIFLLIVCSQLHAQTLTGKVFAADTKKPVALASVFLSNTSIGTVTSADGSFRLSNLPRGQFDVVISFIGYETFVKSIESTSVPNDIQVELKPRASELDAVKVEPFEKEDWNKWKTFFLDNFIGKSEHADRCIITNPEVIKFRNFKKSKRLVAFSDVPLIIENKYLGYRIQYQLENFEYNFKSQILIFQGYPLFEDMKEEVARRFENRRTDLFEGSLMHFMRSFFTNKLFENGFELRRIILVPNLEKQRIKKLFKATIVESGSGIATLGVNSVAKSRDSSAYYSRILQEQDVKEKPESFTIPADSIGFAISDDIAGFAFTDQLQVTYKNKSEPFSYANYEQRRPVDFLQSKFQMVNNSKQMAVFSNGSYYNPVDLMLYGYWAFWEKLATMLPYDYKPSKGLK